LNSMSHDIRTPINAIIGFTSLANDHIDEKERLKDYLGKIQISSDHLLSLVNDVLDMSRIESGQLKIKKPDVDLLVLFNDLCNIVQTDAKRKHLNLVVDTKNIKNPNVICDRLRMNQVLLNCLSNAIKYTPAHGKILLKVTQLPCMRDGYASYRIVVKDTGIGMSEEFLQYLFEPFTREETSTVSGIQGTGLGMAITKHIVDMMGGTITASSRKGYGTEIIISFEFKLYNRQHVLKGYSEESVGNEITSLDGISILLVEDNALNSEIAETLLTELGARVKHVDDGLLAVEELSNANGREYDIILMDIQMPIMDGYEATRRIRKLPNEDVNSIPIIAMTANAFEEDRRLSLEAGMNDHISKPIEMNKLLKIIQSVIR